MKPKKLRDYGIIIGKMKPGRYNAITDVEGVKVGHTTLMDGDINTGVTAVLPHEGNCFKKKVMAASHIINGFGKTLGTVQINELGTIETPIILTNTLNIGIASDALIHYMIDKNPDIGITTGTVNPVVAECNDAYLNDIRGVHVSKKDVIDAIKNAKNEFSEGSVGAGTGMSCYQLKGGIGSASRVITFNDMEYKIGVLVLSNMGKKEDLLVNGKALGKLIVELEGNAETDGDKGSIIIIVATDLPVTERQLKRIAKRSVVGLSRTGAYIGHGSGDIAIAFTTANKINHYEEDKIINIQMVNEAHIDMIFQATVEATEEAILNSMIAADTIFGRNGHYRKSLKEYIHLYYK
ncbi:DmpA family aminopeptidase [Alkaliphilus peptidifermentans]|uniref:D-aminopeptidase n=1 Tax=Alkaliphilus peptidifermentans DSM 18978 TaxID=1120976 RepID=A0A1G5K2K9_9FIRM|nr:P1 family peptidase [Alkaliphilus peptidifermentans]SCY94451.1 D-aminopeptidase [Alkaliphilus peptidifermentans DSM 18978]